MAVIADDSPSLEKVYPADMAVIAEDSPSQEKVYPADMAVIAEDSPSQEKVIPAEIPVITNESPAQDEGFSTDKSKKFFPPCDIDQDFDKTPLPPQEVIIEAPILLPPHKKGKKRRQRKRKCKKIKAVVAIKGPRTKHGIFSGKFHLKLPKRAIGNSLLFIALCTFLQYQLAHSGVPPSALNCMTSVPVSDGPITLQYNSQEVILQERTSCPQKVHMFGFCTACFREVSLLEIACSDAITLEIKHGNLHENRALVRIIPKALDCNHFVKKRHQHRMKKSEQPSSSVHPKVDLRVRKRSMKQKHENMASMENDDDFCNVAVPVTDFPIVIVEDDHNFTFREATFCPTKDDIFERCSACFQDKTVLEIFSKKRADEDYRLFWVEHGNGQGMSNLVYINFEECHQNGNDVSKRQADRPDGGTSTETIQANKGTSWRDSGIFVIPLLFLLALLVGFL
ncbi:uncharacterized protein [Eleutherodactylus coqui]|uniref:uncharacterized protein isoform X2 n=1 Tax=Eleutherodactylus coqui TaxID=57060 RepID=UPI003462FEFE